MRILTHMGDDQIGSRRYRMFNLREMRGEGKNLVPVGRPLGGRLFFWPVAPRHWHVSQRLWGARVQATMPSALDLLSPSQAMSMPLASWLAL